MKIVSWNCGGAFRKKFKQIDALNADVYLIQECENPNLAKDKSYLHWAKNHLWVGDNKNKGLGVFSNKYLIEKQKWEETFKWPDVFKFSNRDTPKYFLPCIVNKLTLLGVWAHQADSPTFRYIGQIWKYLQINKTKIKTPEILIAGDFNSNQIWDENRKDAWWKHSDVVRELSEIGIKSIYHEFRKETQGKEVRKTFYLNHKKDKAYHIDYIFGSKNMLTRVSGLAVGKFASWNKFSDHVPISVVLRY